MNKLEGFKQEYFVLSQLWQREYLGEDDYLTSNIFDAKKFNDYYEASNYFKQNKDKFSDNLYPFEIKMTLEFI